MSEARPHARSDRAVGRTGAGVLALGLGDLRLAVTPVAPGAAVAPGIRGRALRPREPSDLRLAVRVSDAPEPPSRGARVALAGGVELRLAAGALGALAAECDATGVRRVLRLDAARSEGEVELSRAAHEAGLLPLAPPFDALLLATRLAREGALLLRAAAVARGGMALAFTLRSGSAARAVAALLAGRSGALARRRLLVRPGPDRPVASDGELREVDAAPDAVPLGALHLVHPAAELVAEPRCGARAADAVLASALLPIDTTGCVAAYAAACRVAGAVPVVRLGCPSEGPGLARFAEGPVSSHP